MSNFKGDPGLPDDWGSYYGAACPSCGERSHPSGVGDCSCDEADMEEKFDDVFSELCEAEKIEVMERSTKYGTEDCIGANIRSGETFIWLYVYYQKDGFEEYNFTKENWDEICAEFKKQEVTKEIIWKKV